MKNISSILFFIIISISAIAQLKKTSREVIEYYSEGIIKKKTIINENKSRNPDPFDFYRKTKTRIYSFSPSGNLEKTEIFTEKIGEAGLPCYYIRYIIKQYNDSGRLIQHQKMRCDGRKEILKIFDPKGQIISSTKIRRYRQEPANINIE